MSEHNRPLFKTTDGLQTIPAVTADEMREVDRLAEDVFQLSVLQMMENAGRSLAVHALELAASHPCSAAILVGPGGNGGGGLSCTRHLHNHGVQVEYVLARPEAEMRPAAVSQLRTLAEAGLAPTPVTSAPRIIHGANIIIDALLGYSLSGAPRGGIAELINLSNASGKKVLALDLPSGLDATTGEHHGVYIHADRTLTLALPKYGLVGLHGELYLADIGIPSELYQKLDIRIPPLFNGRYSLELDTTPLQA